MATFPTPTGYGKETRRTKRRCRKTWPACWALREKQGYSPQDMLVVGDRAMLDDKIALLYDQKALRYLAGLSAQKTVHKKRLYDLPEGEFSPYLIKTRQGDKQYWLKAVSVPFSEGGKSVTHRGVAVISGPMRDQLRHSRQKKFDDLEQAFRAIQAKADAGQKRDKSAKEVTARAATQCRNSKVGQFVSAKATELDGKIKLTWQFTTGHFFTRVFTNFEPLR